MSTDRKITKTGVIIEQTSAGFVLKTCDKVIKCQPATDKNTIGTVVTVMGIMVTESENFMRVYEIYDGDKKTNITAESNKEYIDLSEKLKTAKHQKRIRLYRNLDFPDIRDVVIFRTVNGNDLCTDLLAEMRKCCRCNIEIIILDEIEQADFFKIIGDSMNRTKLICIIESGLSDKHIDMLSSARYIAYLVNRRTEMHIVSLRYGRTTYSREPLASYLYNDNFIGAFNLADKIRDVQSRDRKIVADLMADSQLAISRAIEIIRERINTSITIPREFYDYRNIIQMKVNEITETNHRHHMETTEIESPYPIFDVARVVAISMINIQLSKVRKYRADLAGKIIKDSRIQQVIPRMIESEKIILSKPRRKN